MIARYDQSPRTALPLTLPVSRAATGSARTLCGEQLAWLAPVLFGLCLSQLCAIATVADAVARPDSAGAASPAWTQDLPAAYQDALIHRRPILVRAGSESCTWCQQLVEQMAKPAVRSELSRWTLVYIDVDKTPGEVQTLGIGPVPALRVLSPRGRLLTSHDGYLEADELVKWLQQSFAEASQVPDALLSSEGEPSLLDVMRLVRQFENRDATVREAAMRRLIPYPKVAAAVVVRSFGEGSLSSKLATYEILQQWQAPVTGVDPWQSDTFTPERKARLAQWLQEFDPGAMVSAPETLTPEDLKSLRADMQRMLAVDGDEAAAIRERIARFGKVALPEVVLLLKDAATDHDRQRLLTLRYRLVSGGTIVLTWPGGLERLADNDPEVRHLAAEQLAANATADLQPLLLELFSDPDPLVRELSLRGLRNVGGKQATAALVALLQDPEPNVRAAVLKQLSEDAPAGMVDEIAAYVKQESDADLVVHGVRYFRAVGNRRTIPSLLALLEHESWQVRAEAAEAIGEVLERADNGSHLNAGVETPDIYDALLTRLEDPDAFVVSRVLAALKNIDAERAVEPLAQAAARHPRLATEIVTILAQGSHMREKAVPHLREFFLHDEAALRAAAVSGLCQSDPDSVQDILAAAIRDEHQEVRIAAANSLLAMLESKRPSRTESVDPFDMAGGRVMMPGGLDVESSGSASGSTLATRLFEGAMRLFSPGSAGNAPQQPLETPPSAAVSKEHQPAVTPEESTTDTPLDDRTQPAGEPAEDLEGPSVLDTWLTELYAGKHRAAWMNQLVDPLREMLSAQDPVERHAAALALLPFDHASQSLPVLLAAAKEDPKLLERSAEALKWLPGTERRNLFWEIVTLAQDDITLASLVGVLGEINDPRDIDMYWKLLERKQVSKDLLPMLQYVLRKACLGERYYDPESFTTRQRRHAAAAIEPHVSAGPALKQLMAIVLLADVDAEKATEEARRLMDDTSYPDTLRLDAFQLQLLMHTSSERAQQAIEILAGSDVQRQRIALQSLALENTVLATLPGSGLDISSLPLRDDFMSSARAAGDEKIIVPEPPRLLKPEHVRPFLTSADPESAAYAGYLLALCGDADGLDPLLRYWRPRKEDGQLGWLVYRAIAVMDDPQYIPVLREIYSRVEDEFDVQEFYWTIRIMSGPEILQFRKRLRQEVGISNLQ